MTVRNSSPHSEGTEQHSKKTEEISRDEILDILAACEGVGLPAAIDDDTLLVIDSYAAIWIQHLLEEQHGIVVELSGETADVDSVSSLQALVNRRLVREAE